jgi:1,4-alpha-glucan branching enzyme
VTGRGQERAAEVAGRGAAEVAGRDAAEVEERAAAAVERRDGEAAGCDGELAIVLHSHMPYIEGFGTWPFGEEWLWEAIATSYLPLLELLDGGAPITLSLTPVLCDQLEAPGALDRCREFLGGVRVESHRRDIASAGGPGEIAALEHSAAQYERARERLIGLDLLAALGRHVAWTSSATHAILPLLATDAGIRLQLRAGIDAHRRRFGDGWRGGLWLPECAYAPWLDELLTAAGVRAVCVELTDVLEPHEHLRPLGGPAGPLLVPIDRATIDLVWSRGGYPADAAYRNYHHFTPHRHRAWSNDGAPYDPERAADAARRHAADFVARTRERVAGGGLAVCALDTELLGDWWHEGPQWLAAVVDEAARQGLRVVRLDDALDRADPARRRDPERPPATSRDHQLAAAPPDLPVTSWGTPRDLSTWSAPPVTGMAWSARDAELRTVAAGRGADARAVRELLALQSSDWAFLVARDLAEPYGRERAAGHREALEAALAAPGTLDARLHNLAPDASVAPLIEP